VSACTVSALAEGRRPVESAGWSFAGLLPIEVGVGLLVAPAVGAVAGTGVPVAVPLVAPAALPPAALAGPQAARVRAANLDPSLSR
jgi:hypothetical protein